MATRPGILIFGGGDVQGGLTGNAPAALVTPSTLTPLSEFYSLDLLRVTPDNGTTGASQSAALSWWPWFDDQGGTVYVVASGATSTTVQVTPDPSWTVDEWAGFTVTNSLPSPGFGFENHKIAVISNTPDTITVASWTTTPTAATGLHFNKGTFEDYHPVGAWRTVTELAAPAYRGGASTAQLNVGVGYDAGLVRELYENVFTADPYFVMAKFATLDTAVDYASAGSERTAFETWLTKVEAAFAVRYPLDTLVWKYVIDSLAPNDVNDWIVNTGTAAARITSYLADVQARMAWLRGASVLDNSTCRFLFLNHDHSIRGVDLPAGIPWTASQHTAAAGADANVRTVEFDGRGFANHGPGASLQQPSEDRRHYSPHVYFDEAPPIIRKAIELWEDGNAPNVDGAIPVYVLIGDSIEVATNLTTTYTTALGSSTLTTTVRDTRQKIWNRASGAVETYRAHYNSLTSGTAQAAPTALAGPEFSLTHELMKRHPDTGFVIIKRASNSSALVANATAYSSGTGGRWSKSYAATEHYDEMRADIENAIQSVNVTLDKQAELMAFIVGLGTNDAAVAGGGALFAAELPVFCTNLRDDFGTHVTGKDTPIVWRMPQLGASTAINVEMLAVRAALVARTGIDPQFRAMNVDDLERAADDLHLTPASTVAFGRRYDDELNFVELPNC
jgi:hypothetical protein